MFYLWLKWLAILEMWVVVEAATALLTGTFTLQQMQAQWGRGHSMFLPFNRHGGMLGDILIVSPLVALLIAACAQYWSKRDIGVALLVATVLGLIMSVIWAKGSVNVWDSFARRGKPQLNAWIHGLYMVFCLTIILLFYFRTSNVSVSSATVITLALALHVAVGALQPRWYAWGYIDSGTWTIFTRVMILLGVGFAWLVFKK